MQLLQHFKELTLRPKNAQELKGLILQLAILGKLTANWRAENKFDKDANELLLSIKEYNSAQLKSNKRRVNIPKGDLKELNYLPEGWVKVANYDLFNLQKGRNPKDLSETVKKYPYHDIESLDRGNVRRFSDDEKAPKCKKTDILVVCDGSRSGLILDGKPGIVGSTLAIIHTPPFIKDYIKLIFLQDFERANANMIGAAIPHLNTKGLLLTTIGLPPLEEQKEIVRVVETLFKEVEQLEQLTVARIGLKEDFVTSALQQLTTNITNQEWTNLQDHFKSFFNETTNIKKLRETILQLAVQGKLTADWRSSHPELVEGSNHASNLLKRIQKEKTQLIKDKKIKKEKALPPITEDEIPYELPEGWVWCRLQDIVNVGTGSTPATSNSSYYGGEIPWYTSSATNDLYAKESEKQITEKALEETNCKIFPEGTLIIAMYGQGKTRGQISELIIPGATNQAVAAMVFYKTSKEFKEYIKYFFRKIYDEIRLLAEGGAQPNLNVGKIKNTILPLPPLEEQKAIVEKVNALMGLCDALEQEVQQSQQHSEMMMQSVLKEVFEGDKIAI